MSSVLFDLHDATTALRDWMRVVDSPVVSGPLFTYGRAYAGGVPTDHNYDAQSAIVVTRIGGGYDPPLDEGLYQFDIWARTRVLADVTSNALLDLLASNVFDGADMGNGFRYRGTDPGSIVVNFVPEPNPDLFHRVVTAQVLTTFNATS